MTTTAKPSHGVAANQPRVVDGPEFLRLMISNRAMYRADSPDHRGVVDFETGVMYIIPRNSFAAYLRTRNESEN